MKENIPVLLLKKLTILPSQEVRIELSNELSKKIIDLSSKEFGNKVLVILPLNTLEESPTITDLPLIGVLAYINSKIVLPSKNYRVVLKGLSRVKVYKYLNYKSNKSILLANTKMLYIDNGETLEESALKKKLLSLLKTYINANPEISNSVLSEVNKETNLDDLTDIIVNFMRFPKDKKIYYMNEFDNLKRARTLIKDLNIELEIIKLNNKIEDEIKEEFNKEQKEYLVKQKIEKLNAELGLSSSKEDEISKLRNQIDKFNAPTYIKEKLNKELQKYIYTPNNNPEISSIRSYIETILSLSFESSTEEGNANKISKALDKTHYGLNEVKTRIIEYAILKNTSSLLENPIICLIGPPGVGKTSIARSISVALKRNFAKISLGGLNDSSELIGHRRTYLGAAPGKIINAIIKSKSNNPVILLDEVDKLIKDYKGDPASTLLDILDSNQNKEFIDNYIEEAYDLSNVLFILTANDYNSIPRVLRDRLEIINIPSYTIYDKKDIALNYLIPTICEKYKISKLNLDEEIVFEIIKSYTLESGVRDLNRVLDKLIRYIIINKVKEKTVTKDDLINILGNPITTTNLKINEIGEVNILGVTPLGGELLKVQSTLIPTNEVVITGLVGDILKDSIKLAISYLESKNLLKSKGLHLNITSSKYIIDGSSGTLGIITSILSLINEKQISSSIAFLGNVDLYGNILKVSKLKEKIITAYNNKINTIYLPKANKCDEEDIPLFILKEVNLMYISNCDEILKLLFKKR